MDIALHANLGSVPPFICFMYLELCTAWYLIRTIAVHRLSMERVIGLCPARNMPSTSGNRFEQAPHHVDNSYEK
jgi:hypothetical protein